MVKLSTTLLIGLTNKEVIGEMSLQNEITLTLFHSVRGYCPVCHAWRHVHISRKVLNYRGVPVCQTCGAKLDI